MAVAAEFCFVQRDTGPQVQIALRDEDTKVATDLTGATVKMHMKAPGEDTDVLEKTLYVNPNNATAGIAIINWDEGDLDVDPGVYLAEIEVTRASGVVETVYDVIKFRLREEFA